jgi:hypothetical protein
MNVSLSMHFLMCLNYWLLIYGDVFWKSSRHLRMSLFGLLPFVRSAVKVVVDDDLLVETNSPEAIALAISDTRAGSFSGGEFCHLCIGLRSLHVWPLLGIGVPDLVGVYSSGV